MFNRVFHKLHFAKKKDAIPVRILIRLLFHLILIVFQSYGLKRKHLTNEGHHDEGHEGGDLRPRKVHKVTFK